MTLEEKAEEYAKAHLQPDEYWYPNCAVTDLRRKAFIAGYTMRDGESQPLLEACQKIIELRSLIEYGDVTESNQGEALAMFRLVDMCEKAIELFTTTP